MLDCCLFQIPSPEMLPSIMMLPVALERPAVECPPFLPLPPSSSPLCSSSAASEFPDRGADRSAAQPGGPAAIPGSPGGR